MIFGLGFVKKLLDDFKLFSCYYYDRTRFIAGEVGG